MNMQLPDSIAKPSRRQFLIASGGATAGLIIGTALPSKKPRKGFVGAAPPAPQLNVFAGPGSAHLQIQF